MYTIHEEDFVEGFNEVSFRIHSQMTKQGFNESTQLEDIALMHSELGEATEGIRHNNPPSDHIPEFTSEEEELADVVIRIMHYSKKRNCRIAEAIVAKCEYNLTRPYKHGKII